ncbi:MAG: ribonuclease R, partial [Coxiellaceae bacterium]|nr:ribonuclease R [Coxiellaceae bacterium]
MTKRKRKKDPHQKREAKKYEHPVPSREFIMERLQELGEPQNFNELLSSFSLKSAEEREGLRRRLKAMQRDGQLICNRRGKFASVETMELVKGYVQGHRDGFGFLIPEDEGADVFLPAREMRSVFPLDRVLVRVISGDRPRREGVIVEILESNTETVVGRFYKEGGVAFIDPDDKNIAQDIIIPTGEQGNAKPGQYVLVEVLSQPTKRHQPTGRVIEILGDDLTPGMEVELSIRSHDIPYEWPESVKRQANKFSPEVKQSDIKDRKDFRDLPFVTIDGEDARDFDDAVYCEHLKDGNWKLYVAIADVSHYVKPNSPLDREAIERGNSVYFPSRVIPMLPEILSNELCSLKPNVDRLAVVCEMTVDDKAQVIHHQFHEAVIHSHARLTYTTVAAWLSGDKEANPELFPHIKALDHLYKMLIKEKMIRGAIAFETTETRVVFGQGGKIDRIVPVHRNEAHKIIEEAMLLANVTAAHHLEASKLPTLYRIHEAPDEVKILALRDFLKAFGLRLNGGLNPTGRDYTNLLTRIADRPDVHLLQMVMLRSLPQAIYWPENLGHFGLSYDGYCHFTSPIRRYPDLLVHRALKHLIHKKPKKDFPYQLEDMEEYSEHCSLTERRADLATRDALDWLKCDYMTENVGKEFEGVIMDVTSFGLFVELNDIYVQGLLHITALHNDYYDF